MIEILPGIRPRSWWEEFWNDPLCDYGEPGKKIPIYAAQFYEQFIRDGTRPKAVDIGSGNGRYAVVLAKIGYDVDAVELTESGMERIRELSKAKEVQVHATQGDFTKLCGEIRAYDAVVSAGLLEEVEPAHHHDIIQGYKNWTRIGGYVLIKYCLEILGRGQLVEEGLVPKLFTSNDWDIIFTEEGTELHPSRGKYVKEGGVDSAVRTGTLVAQKLHL